MEIQNSKILIIDDEPELSQLVKELLFREGFLCAGTAAACREAESQIREKTWQLILMDVMLPDGNGFDLYQKMKQEGLLSDTPVIFLSARDEDPQDFVDLDSVRMTILRNRSCRKNFSCVSKPYCAGHTAFR